MSNMYALNLNTNGRILSATYPRYVPANAVIMEHLPEKVEAQTPGPEGDLHNYLCIDKQYIYDPLPEPEPPEAPNTESNVWNELDAAYQEGVNSI